MTLRQRQSKFARLIPRLIDFAYEQGYEITFGDAWAFNLWSIINLILDVLPENLEKKVRSRTHKLSSFHYDRLAIDLNLFKDGKFLTSTKAHTPLGIYWESLDPDCTWGGRRGDGNHYSLGEI